MKKIRFTKKELEVLIKHWEKNLDYGWDGTFGGYEESDKRLKAYCQKEMKIGETILKKLMDI